MSFDYHSNLCSRQDVSYSPSWQCRQGQRVERRQVNQGQILARRLSCLSSGVLESLNVKLYKNPWAMPSSHSCSTYGSFGCVCAFSGRPGQHCPDENPSASLLAALTSLRRSQTTSHSPVARWLSTSCSLRNCCCPFSIWLTPTYS